MPNVIYLLLRRMRKPLIVLICTYAVSVLGLVLVPGMDNLGRPWRMDFFHAFYFVSFMGSTIGFGEIPYPFSGAQRLWTIVTIYATVVAWLYAIGALLAIVQDPAFRRATARASFVRGVRRIKEPFYLVCGYGDTGSLVVQSLARRGIRSTVIDIDQTRIDDLEIESLHVHVPGLCADASDADALAAAGLRSPHCAGVVAVTNADQVNLTIAITSKLLAPTLKVICRSEYHDSAANMASFGTDHVINPFDTFADRFAMAIHSPSLYLVYQWLTDIGQGVDAHRAAPPRGTWVICGYGRFGKAMARYLAFEGVRTVIIEAAPERTEPPPGAIAGRGTEAVTLREAKVEQAVGIVAGTDNDANNLSIVITARELNPDLFTVARLGQRRNTAIFAAARPDLTMQPSTITARRVLALLASPLLADFLRLARHKDSAWADALVTQLTEVCAGGTPDHWSLAIDRYDAAGVHETLRTGGTVTVGHLLTDPHDRGERLAGVALLLKHGDGAEELLPGAGTELRPDDQLLFAGRPRALRRMRTSAANRNVLDYVRLGVEHPSGYLWRWLAQRRDLRNPSS